MHQRNIALNSHVVKVIVKMKEKKQRKVNTKTNFLTIVKVYCTYVIMSCIYILMYRSFKNMYEKLFQGKQK